MPKNLCGKFAGLQVPSAASLWLSPQDVLELAVLGSYGG